MKIGKESKNKPDNHLHPLPSSVVKKSTHSFLGGFRERLKLKKDNSPRLFLFSLIAILAVFVILVVGFLFVQSQGATYGNVYRAKLPEYLEKVYNTSTIDNDNPMKVALSIEAIKAPKLDGFGLGFMSYNYISAKTLRSDVEANAKALMNIAKENGDFYKFYTLYTESMDEIKTLPIGASDRISTLENAKAKYQNLLTEIQKINLPTELQASQNNIKSGLEEAVKVIDELIASFSRSDNSAYALASYKYSLNSDTMSNNFETMRSYNEQISARLKVASSAFNEYRKSLSL